MTKLLEQIIELSKTVGVAPIKSLDTIAIGVYPEDEKYPVYYDSRMCTNVYIPKEDFNETDCVIDHIKIWRTWEFHPKG